MKQRNHENIRKYNAFNASSIFCCVYLYLEETLFSYSSVSMHQMSPMFQDVVQREKKADKLK